ncbi:N-acetylmuramoyl-L-alanine amidase [uncultured Bacteroides sp.]|uniref:N-acetylmuramoyl-L-alanine amidase n=1 Tax=uncultured Bacteroides sp. TaxID=162156 RepID=UPI0025E31300|nr:N-acetylmuramoyl-L-alanine amidase [uncultured Bacteroides sp.]
MKESEENYLPREIKLLVIHCSATRCNAPFSVEQLRLCHLQRGFTDIGYHFYITRNGELHHCRPVSEPGAHVRGFNRHSIGICYEGGLDEEGRPTDTRTQAQRLSLIDLLTILRYQYPEAQILGHYQLSAKINKARPVFNAQKEYANL